jgi:hypothetical protein
MNGQNPAQDEALLAAMALVRQAIEFSEAEGPAGSAADVLLPYLERVSPHLSQGEDGAYDVMPALTALAASLAQIGGAFFAYVQRESEDGPVPVAELLSRWDDYEATCVLDDGKPAK